MKNNSKDKKSNMIIDCYTQPIFPTHNLYVVRNSNKEEIDKLFEYADEKPIEINTEEFTGATYYGVIEKSTGAYCILVILAEDIVKECQEDIVEASNLCSHEALHAAYRVLSRCDMTLDDSTNEVYAYFIGWVTKSIMTTLMKK